MLLNPTSSGLRSLANPDLGSQTWNQFVASFLQRKLSDPAYANVDGYMLDNFVDHASALIDDVSRVDLNNTNTRSGVPDAVWSAAMLDLAGRVRSELPDNRMLMGNDGGHNAQLFGPYLAGGMLEGIDETGRSGMNGALGRSMDFYRSWIAYARQPHTFIFDGSPHAETLQAGAVQYQTMRFLLTLALTGDGYFAFDDYNIDDSHETLWWYDEYDNAGAGTGYLGQPSGPASEPLSGVYRRDFAAGVSICNTTDQVQTIDLGGPFVKIRGQQVPEVNDGSVVSRVQLQPRDGLILLRK
jgi:hypothetical protein